VSAHSGKFSDAALVKSDKSIKLKFTSRLRCPENLVHTVSHKSGTTQPLTKMSNSNLSGGKRRPALKATTSEPSMSRLSRKSGILDLSQPCGSPGLLQFSFTFFRSGYSTLKSEFSLHDVRSHQNKQHSCLGLHKSLRICGDVTDGCTENIL
jgi:hypothetical protein